MSIMDIFIPCTVVVIPKTTARTVFGKVLLVGNCARHIFSLYIDFEMKYICIV
jgi:hypothetical protein